MNDERLTRDSMDQTWERIDVVPDNDSMSGLRPSAESRIDSYAAVDRQGVRHLLIGITDDSDPITVSGSSGLRVGNSKAVSG